ncbi:MAG: sugar kinase [Lachnospiraceae bacterium]|nr:sugar kinase [Lachnospiraceae bacterium]
MVAKELVRKNFDLLSLGELLLRLSPNSNERLVRGDVFQKSAGGAELNVVSGASLLGLHTGIISKIPANDIGTYIKNRIRFCGVSDDYLIYDSSPDARLGIYYYENGAHPRKPNVVYDRKHTSIGSISIDEFPESMFSATRCFHTSGITLALGEQVRETAIEMMKRFKEHGALISFDVNFRANLWTGDEARECIEKILPYVDVFFCSEDTARLTFLKKGNVHEIMKSFTEEYPITIVASTQRTVHSPKIHSFGSVIFDKITDQFYEEPPYENIEVVDRIGSGDAYISGALYGLLNYNMDCQKAMEFGNATSSVKNTIPGDLPSSDLREIEHIMESHKQTGPQSEMNR